MLYLFTVVDDDDKQKLEMRTVCESECVEIHFTQKDGQNVTPGPNEMLGPPAAAAAPPVVWHR